MAFDLKSFTNQYTKKSTSGFDVNKFVAQYSNQTKQNTGFDINEFTAQFGGRPKVDSSEGLYSLASQSGLQDKADEIMRSQKGESTKEIFSGGFISDIFDTLNALQYGVAGMLKGKSFSEGVKTRQSFTDKDALGDKGIPGMIAGVALDILTDPLTYIAPYTIVKKIPLAARAVEGVRAATFGRNVTRAIEGTDKTYEALEGGTKLGKYLAQKFQWMAGADPVFRETFERGLKNTAISTEAVVNMGKSVAKLDKETAAKLLTKDETGRFMRVKAKDLEKILKPEEFEAVANIYNKIDNLGKEAVDLGLLSKETFEENIGTYLKNAYTEYETAKNKGVFNIMKSGIKGIKKRKDDLTPEKMKELGQIDNPAYLLFKSAVDLTRDVENAKMFKSVAENFGTKVAQPGFTKLPEGTRLGALAGKYVPDNMALYLNEVIEPAKDTLTKNLVANFKFFKVVMNPGTHARNMISNQILNYWKLGMNPLDPRTIRANAIASKQILKGGKWVDEAKPLGYNIDTFASAEMKNLLNSPEASAWGKGVSSWKKVKEKLGNIYQAEENQAKLAAYIFNRQSKKMNPEDAWKAAESATFNYAQVTPFVRKLRESLFGFPFITFTVKSTPAALETVAKNPGRVSVIGKIKKGIEEQADIKETERERASEPSWVRDGFYVKLPIKDKFGRSSYLDLTYILPFGDLMTGNFLERPLSRETGLPKSRVNAIAEKSPFIQLVSSISKNENFYGNKIWKESDTTERQLADLSNFLAKTIMPPTVSDQLHNGYNEKGETQWSGIYGSLQASDENQKRTLMEELLRNVGAKVQPIDADIQETYQEWNKRKALESMLIENGVLNEFRKVYQPDEY